MTRARHILLSLALWLCSFPALAQTSPNWTYGYVPTVGQWNYWFGYKQDYLGAAPLLITGGTLTGALGIPPSTTVAAGLNIGQGVAPTSPNNGDIWIAAAGGLFWQSNGVSNSYLSTNSPTITTPTFLFGTLANSFINFQSNNTGFTNQLQVLNGGTVSNAATQAIFLTGLSGVAGTYIQQTVTGGASPSASLGTGSNTPGGFNIYAGSGTLSLNSPQLNFGTGGASSILATSVNSGASNQFQVQNGGTLSNSGTIALTYQVLSGGSNTYLVESVTGGATPSAGIASGAGMTGGLSISALAGQLSLASPNLTGTVQVGGFTQTFPGAAATISQTVASGAQALSTAAITSTNCVLTQATATGTLTTDTVTASFNGDPTAVTGYAPLTTGMLTIFVYPTSGQVNFKVCNSTAGSITPGAITLNWRVVR
jgi:hypothetical protein